MIINTKLFYMIFRLFSECDEYFVFVTHMRNEEYDIYCAEYPFRYRIEIPLQADVLQYVSESIARHVKMSNIQWKINVYKNN